MNPTLFFILSGEHETLPPAEVMAVLESEGINYKNVRLSPKVLILEAKQDCLPTVVSRAGMCEVAGRLVLECRDNEREIIETAAALPFCDFLQPGDTFSVRVHRVSGSSRHLHKMELQSRIGEVISRLAGGSKVDLKNPEKEFVGVISQGYFVLGHVTAKRQDQGATLRRPQRRPVTHPSTIKPRLARCFVNLSRARKGGLLIDPFCGTGGILIEAGVMGCRAVGLDLDPQMILKASKNLRHFNLEDVGLVVADSRKAPYLEAPSMATDPPYGRGASTQGSELADLLAEFMGEARSVMQHDGFLCIAAPVKIKVKEIGLDAGLNVVEDHVARVHRSLVREVAVFSRRRRKYEEKVPWKSYS